MNAKTIHTKVEVDRAELEATLEKANELVAVLNKAKSLLDDLAGRNSESRCTT